jgi:hypothetical protein
MKTGTALATTLFAIASFPLMAQQSPATNQPDSPAAQQSPAGAETTTPNSAAANPAASAVEMSPINGELVSKLDSKTAKTGDSVVVQTKSATKTADGTAIPKGSKLVGHVVGAQSSGAGENSQLALLFDHIELKGGQSVPVHSQVQSIAPAGGAASASGSAPMSGPPAGSSSPSANGANSGSGGGSGGASGASAQGAGGYAGAAPTASSGPAAGTVVAKTGQIAISTTSIPGVLLANNAHGQQDPRMARTSSILLGAKQEIQLDSGTQMVVGVSAAGAGTQ